MRFYKKLFSIKYENILSALCIPLAIIQFTKAHVDFRLASVIMSFTLYGGLALAIRVGRKEALEEIKQGIYEPLINVYEILEDINELVRKIDKLKNSIKKEVITNATNINDQIYIEANVK